MYCEVLENVCFSLKDSARAKSCHYYEKQQELLELWRVDMGLGNRNGISFLFSPLETCQIN